MRYSRPQDACIKCEAGTYSIRTGLGFSCVQCPAGGDCIAGGDAPTFAVGTWVVVDFAYSLTSCPSGYAPNTGNLSQPDTRVQSCLAAAARVGSGDWVGVGDANVVQSPTGNTKDECIRCEAGTYSLKEGLSHSCLACPQGGTCAGGSAVQLLGNWFAPHTAACDVHTEALFLVWTLT